MVQGCEIFSELDTTTAISNSQQLQVLDLDPEKISAIKSPWR